MQTGLTQASFASFVLDLRACCYLAAPMFENAFKNIDDILHKDAGCGSELDYVEQTS